MLAKRLAAVRSGALGTPQFARLSVAHGYHAVSLARQFLNAGQQPVRVTVPQLDGKDHRNGFPLGCGA